MKYFLMEFDRATGERELKVFDDEVVAMDALRDREAARKPSVEVVLFFAKSEDQLRRTHSRFFMSEKEIGERMREVLLQQAEALGT